MSTSANTLSGDPASVRVRAFENASERTGRILLAALFLISGLGKIGSYAAAAGYMSSVGLPSAVLPLVIVTEVAGAISIIVGWKTRVTAFLLARFVAYLHVVDYSAFGFPPVPAELMSLLRESFGGAFIRAGGLDRTSAERELATGRMDLIAFGRAFHANPDLIERLKANAALNYPRLILTSESLTSAELAA
jgi:putative oxidoreductase